MREEPGQWEQRPWRNTSFWLLLQTCSKCFLLCPMTTVPAVAPPTAGWALLHLSPIRHHPTGLPIDQSDGEGISYRGSLFSECRLCEVGEKLTNILCKVRHGRIKWGLPAGTQHSHNSQSHVCFFFEDTFVTKKDFIKKVSDSQMS